MLSCVQRLRPNAVHSSASFYNVRLLDPEVEGAAEVERYWIDLTTGARELVRPPALESTASAGGPHSVETAAVFDPCVKTVVVSNSGNTRCCWPATERKHETY